MKDPITLTEAIIELGIILTFIFVFSIVYSIKGAMTQRRDRIANMV